MYKIVFHYLQGEGEVYGGGTYTVNHEKYAILNEEKPKLYKSEKVARNAAEKLLCSCVNSGIGYSVVEEEE